ncbi:hypothetical protein HK098_007794, partial [Nowakowskiella sp. JEL0407]
MDPHIVSDISFGFLTVKLANNLQLRSPKEGFVVVATGAVTVMITDNPELQARLLESINRQIAVEPNSRKNLLISGRTNILMDDLVYHLEQTGIKQVILSAYGFKTPLYPQTFLLSVEFNEALLNSLPLNLIDGNVDSYGAIVKLPLSQERLREWNRQERTPMLTVYPRVMHRLKAVMSHSTYSEIPDTIKTFNKRIADFRNVVEILKGYINGNEVLDESMTGFRVEHRLNANTMLEVREMVLGNNLFILEDIFPRFGITMKFVPYYLYFERLDQMIGILSTHKSLQQRSSNQVPVELQSMLADTININDPEPVWIPENYDIRALITNKDFRNNLVCPFEKNHNLARSRIGTRGPDPQSKFSLKGGVKQLRMICRWCKVNLTEKTLLRMLRNYFDESGESFNDYPEFFMDDVETESDDEDLENMANKSLSENISDDGNLENADDVGNLDNVSDNGNLVDVSDSRSSPEVAENDDNEVIDVNAMDIVGDNMENFNYEGNLINVDAIDRIEDRVENGIARNRDDVNPDLDDNDLLEPPAYLVERILETVNFRKTKVKGWYTWTKKNGRAGKGKFRKMKDIGVYLARTFGENYEAYCSMK